MKRKKEFKKSLFMTAIFLIMCCMMLLPSADVSAATVKLSANTVTLNVGQSKTIKVKGTSAKAKWSSNKKSVAKVNSSGKITAVGRGTATITAKVGKKSYKCKVLVYRQTSTGNAAVDKKVRSIINKEIKPGMTDAEKVKAIHDYIITHCDYDFKHVGIIEGVWHTAYGALINQKAVCNGYAAAFQVCMDALNIPCQEVVGRISDGTAHGWNLVQVNKSWYHIDLTFDDPMFSDKDIPEDIDTFISYEYFFVNDQKMKADGRQWHKEWLGEGYDISEACATIPTCSSSPDKFISIIAPVSKSTKQVANNMYTEYKKGKTFITIVVPQKTYKKNKDFLPESFSSFSSRMNEHFSPDKYINSYRTYSYGGYMLIDIFFK